MNYAKGVAEYAGIRASEGLTVFLEAFSFAAMEFIVSGITGILPTIERRKENEDQSFA